MRKKVKSEKSEKVYNSCFDALEAVLGTIPPEKFVMSILAVEGISEETVEKMTEVYNSMKRPQPLMFKGCPDSTKNWLCDPKSRKNDLCITEMQHIIGIETDILTYILPGPCPSCDVSSENPVKVVSRATFMHIIAKYNRSSCTHCEWEDEETKIAKKLLMQKYKEFCSINSDVLTTPPASPVSNQSGKDSPLAFNQLLDSNELETPSTIYDGQPAAKKPMLFDKFNEDLTCTLCCEVFIHPVGLKCGHLFCNFCLIQCMKRKNNCPSCREPIPEKPNKQVCVPITLELHKTEYRFSPKNVCIIYIFKLVFIQFFGHFKVPI